MRRPTTWRVFKLVEGLAATTALACLAACGGGGGGADGTSIGPPGPTLTASASTESITISPTANTPSPSVTLTIANAPTSGLYSAATYLGTAVQTVNLQWDSTLTGNNLDGDIVLNLYGPQFIGSGTYQDTVTIKVCQDSNCNTQIAGSPVSIAVTYTVTGNLVSDASYAVTPMSFDLEVPSSATAPTATVNVTAYDVPPYGAYVHYTSQTGGAVASMSFTATPATSTVNSYATGALTINLKAPGTLGPGFYSDVVTMSICYDEACTKPAPGSPYSIPVTYTVTASAGREFQQQVVSLDLTTLAADPLGTTLYGATAFTNSSAAQLVSINPVSGAVTTLLALDDNVSQMVVSQDGQYIYLVSLGASSNTPEVTRVNVSSMTLDFSFFPTVLFVAPVTVSVSPQNSRTWSLASLVPSNSSAPAAFTVQVFDDNVGRPDTWSLTSNLVYSNYAQWSSDGSTIYVRDLNLTAVTVTPTGLGAGTQLPPPDYGDHTIQQVGGLIYSDGGSVVDPAADALLGKYVFSTPSSQAAADSAALAIDITNNRTFAAYEDIGESGAVPTLESYDRSQFTGLWIARLPVAGTPVRWGANGLAFIASNPNLTGPALLYIITGTFVAAPQVPSVSQAHLRLPTEVQTLD